MRQLLRFRQIVGQGAAFDEAAGDETGIADLAGVVDGHDVGVPQVAGRPGLTEKALGVGFGAQDAEAGSSGPLGDPVAYRGPCRRCQTPRSRVRRESRNDPLPPGRHRRPGERTFRRPAAVVAMGSREATVCRLWTAADSVDPSVRATAKVLATPAALNRLAEVLLFDAVSLSAMWATALNLGHDRLLGGSEGATIEVMEGNVSLLNLVQRVAT